MPDWHRPGSLGMDLFIESLSVGIRTFVLMTFIFTCVSLPVHAGSPRVHNLAPEFVEFWQTAKVREI